MDGKIADQQGNTQWLHEIPNPDQSDYGYGEFVKSVDTTLMGNTTYQQVLGFGDTFPYVGLKNYVVTRNKALTKDEYAQFVSEDIAAFIRDIKTSPGKNIWCIGGAKLNTLLFDHDLIDELQVFIMPIILGEGIPFTHKLEKLINFKLTKSIEYASGVVQLNYKSI